MRLFGRRPTTTPQAEAERRDAQRREDAAEQERRRGVAAQEQRQRERAAAEFEAEQARASAESIAAACKQFGHWFPGQPAPESRLGGRPTWRERIVEAIREGWH